MEIKLKESELVIVASVKMERNVPRWKCIEKMWAVQVRNKIPEHVFTVSVHNVSSTFLMSFVFACKYQIIVDF